MKKKLVSLLLIISLLFITTACDFNSTKNKKIEKGNCSALDCIMDLKPENTVEEINKVIGFDGELINKDNNMYSWKIGKNDKILATYYNSNKATIEAKFDREKIKNDKIDFSSYSEIQDLLKKGKTLTLEEFNDKVKGNGILYLISSSSKKYIWVNKKGEYLEAYFSVSTGKCTFVTGRTEKQ